MKIETMEMKQKNTVKKRMGVLVASALILTVLLSVNYVAAYQWVCLEYGESVPNPQNPRYTCWHDSCQLCVTDALNPTDFNRCAEAGPCQSLNEEGGLDTLPPTLSVSSPTQGGVYGDKSVLVSITSNEPATMSYTDAISGRGRWARLVSLAQSYSGARKFSEGSNTIIFKGSDRNGNEATTELTFFVDSKAPKIKKTFPKKGFANGEFAVLFSEDNPSELTLHYGNFVTGFREQEVNLASCIFNKNNYECETTVSVADYSEEDFEYWFSLEDIAGNVVESKHVSLDVDVTSPVINNPNDFWSQGAEDDNKNIYFNIDLTEQNLDEVSIYDNSDSKPRWKRLCSRLRGNLCIKKVSFKPGHHDVDVQVLDTAGNAVAERISFGVV